MATHNSPKGRPVEVVTGSAGSIEDRGQQVVNLGAAMSEAARILDRLVSDGSDMEGEAIDKLREAAQEVNVELGRAADLYVGVGPFIRTYGNKLGNIQARMNTSVPEAESKWRAYQQSLESLAAAESAPITFPSGTEPSDDGSARREAETQHAEAVGAAQGDRDEAYRLWVTAGVAFDGDYDEWEREFDAAVAGIRSVNADGIADDFWDDLDGFVDFALSVLAVAGVVLAVLAMVVGGPIVALLALTVGVLSLVGTLYQYGRGDAELWEVGLAVLGVIPFGAIGEFASGGFKAGMRAWAGLGRGGLSLGDDLARWTLARPVMTNPSEWISAMRTLGPEAGFVTNSAGDIISAVMSGQDPYMWQVVGELGTLGQQAAYGLPTFGVFVNNVNTGVSGVQGIIDIVTHPDRVLWPTW